MWAPPGPFDLSQTQVLSSPVGAPQPYVQGAESKAALVILIYLLAVWRKLLASLSVRASPRPSAMLYGVILPVGTGLDEAVARPITQG